MTPTVIEKFIAIGSTSRNGSSASNGQTNYYGTTEPHVTCDCALPNLFARRPRGGCRTPQMGVLPNPPQRQNTFSTFMLRQNTCCSEWQFSLPQSPRFARGLIIEFLVRELRNLFSQVQTYGEPMHLGARVRLRVCARRCFEHRF